VEDNYTVDLTRVDETDLVGSITVVHPTNAYFVSWSARILSLNGCSPLAN